MLQLMRHCSEHAEELKHQARVQQQTLEVQDLSFPKILCSVQCAVCEPCLLQHIAEAFHMDWTSLLRAGSKVRGPTARNKQHQPPGR